MNVRPVAFHKDYFAEKKMDFGFDFSSSNASASSDEIHGVPSEVSHTTISQTIRHFKKCFKWILPCFEEASIFDTNL